MERNVIGSMERERYTRKILIIEAHLDDFEIGMSAWLAKMAGYPTEIMLVTLMVKVIMMLVCFISI